MMKPSPHAPSHFLLRTAERIGQEVDGHDLYRRLVGAVWSGGNDFARFSRRIEPDAELWRFEWDGEVRYAVVDSTGTPRTIWPNTPGASVKVRPKGKRRIVLVPKDHDRDGRDGREKRKRLQRKR